MLVGQGAKMRGQSSASPLSIAASMRCRAAIGSAPRARQISVPSTCASRSSHSRHKKRPRYPLAPVSRTVFTVPVGPASVGAAAKVSASMNLSSVKSAARTAVASRAVHRGESWPRRGRNTLAVNVIRDGSQRRCGTDNRLHRHVDVVNLLQQRAEGKCRERIAAELNELGVGWQARLSGLQAERGDGGAPNGVDRRQLPGRGAQLVDLVLLPRRDIGVHRVQPFAVAGLQRRAQQLADPRQQTVGAGERFGLDQEGSRDLMGVEAILSGDPLQRARDQRMGVAVADPISGSAQRPPAGTAVRCCRRRRSAGCTGRRSSRPPVWTPRRTRPARA